MHWERTRKCFSHRGQSQSALRTSRTQPGRRFCAGLAGAAIGPRLPLLALETLLHPSAPGHDSGSLMRLPEMLGERERARTAPSGTLTSARLAGGESARVVRREASPVPAAIRQPQGGTRGLRFPRCLLSSPGPQSIPVCAKAGVVMALRLLLLSLAKPNPAQTCSCSNPPFLVSQDVHHFLFYTSEDASPTCKMSSPWLRWPDP